MSAEKILHFAKEEEKSGNRGRAEELYQLALAADSDHADTLASYGAFLQNVCQDYDSAEQIYQKGLRLNPHHLDTLQNYAIFLEEVKGDLEEAERMFNVAFDSLAMERTPSPHVAKAKPQVQDASAVVSKAEDVKKPFPEHVSRGPTAATFQSERKLSATPLADKPHATLTKTDEQASHSNHDRGKSKGVLYPTRISGGPQKLETPKLNADVLRTQSAGSTEKALKAPATQKTPKNASQKPRAGTKKSFPQAAQRVDAERRFLDGSFVLTGEEKRFQRHDTAHTGTLHSKPWMGPLDKPRRLPHRREIVPASVDGSSARSSDMLSQAQPASLTSELASTVEATPPDAENIATDESSFLALRAKAQPAHSASHANSFSPPVVKAHPLRRSWLPRNPPAPSHSPPPSSKIASPTPPPASASPPIRTSPVPLSRYDPELRLALRKIFRGVEQQRLASSHGLVSPGTVRGVFRSQRIDISPADAAALAQHFEVPAGSPARNIAPAAFLQAAWQLNLHHVDPAPEEPGPAHRQGTTPANGNDVRSGSSYPPATVLAAAAPAPLQHPLQHPKEALDGGRAGAEEHAALRTPGAWLPQGPNSTSMRSAARGGSDARAPSEAALRAAAEPWPPWPPGQPASAIRSNGIRNNLPPATDPTPSPPPAAPHTHSVPADSALAAPGSFQRVGAMSARATAFARNAHSSAPSHPPPPERAGGSTPLTPPKQGQPNLNPRLQIPSHRPGPEVSAAQWLQQVKVLRQRQGAISAYTDPPSRPLPPSSPPPDNAWVEGQPPTSRPSPWPSLAAAAAAPPPGAPSLRNDAPPEAADPAATWVSGPGPALTVAQLRTWTGAAPQLAAALQPRGSHGGGGEEEGGGQGGPPWTEAQLAALAASTGLDALILRDAARLAATEASILRDIARVSRSRSPTPRRARAAPHASGQPAAGMPARPAGRTVGVQAEDGDTEAEGKQQQVSKSGQPPRVQDTENTVSQAKGDGALEGRDEERTFEVSERAENGLHTPQPQPSGSGSGSRGWQEDRRSRSAGPRLGGGGRGRSEREEEGEEVTWKFKMLRPQNTQVPYDKGESELESGGRAGDARAARQRGSRQVVLRREGRGEERGGAQDGKKVQGKGGGGGVGDTGEDSEEDFGQRRLRERAAQRAALRRRGSTGTSAFDVRGGGERRAEAVAMDGYTRRACGAFVEALQQLFLTPSTAFGFFCAHRTDAPQADPFSSRRGPRLSALPASMVSRSDFVLTLPLLGVTLSPAEANCVFDAVAEKRLGVMTYSSLHAALRSFKFISGPDFAAAPPAERPCRAVRERKQAVLRFGRAMAGVWWHPAEAFVFMDPECSDTLSRKNLLQGIRQLHLGPEDVTAEQVLQELARGGVEGVVTVRDFLRHFAGLWQPPHDAGQALRDYEWVKAQGRVDAQARYGEWCARQRVGRRGMEGEDEEAGSVGEERGPFGSGSFRLPSSGGGGPLSLRKSTTPSGSWQAQAEDREGEGQRGRDPMVVMSAERALARATLGRESAVDAAREAAEGRGAKKRGLARVMDIFSMIEASPVQGVPKLLPGSALAERSPHSSSRTLADDPGLRGWVRDAAPSRRWGTEDEEEEVERAAAEWGAREAGWREEVLEERRREHLERRLPPTPGMEALALRSSALQGPAAEMAASTSSQRTSRSREAWAEAGSGRRREQEQEGEREAERRPAGTRRSLEAELELELEGGGRRRAGSGRERRGSEGAGEGGERGSSVLERTGSSDSSPEEARRAAMQRVKEKRQREAARLRRQEEERRARKTRLRHEKAELRRTEEEARAARRKYIKYPEPGDPTAMNLRLFRRHSSAPRARPSSRRSAGSRASSRGGSVSPERSRDRAFSGHGDTAPSTGGLKRAASTGKQRSVRWERSVEEREEWLRRGRGGLGGSRGMAHQGYYSYGM